MKGTLVSFTVFIVFCYVLTAARPQEKNIHPLKKLFQPGADANGGATCATCSVLVGLVEQLSQIYNISIAESLTKFCGFLPSGFSDGCKLIVSDFAPTIIKLLEDKETPDIVCHALNICTNTTGQFCHVFPLPNHNSMDDIKARVTKAKETAKLSRMNLGLKSSAFIHPYYKFIDLCNISAIKPICELINRFGNGHLPVDDLDGDYFSDLPTFRGTSWRGKDCRDLSSNVYPGRYSEDDSIEDTNCNGIVGRDPATGETYESLWCKDTQPMGTVILGDSAAAHFRIPPKWLTSKEMNVEAFQDLFFALENELDWPMLSSGTGYKNSTWPNSVTGPVDSVYLRLRELNRCNHRDYQSIAVNGARAKAMAEDLVKGFARHGMKDKPVFLTLALIGNDVCSGHHDIDHMTTPEEFYNSTLETLRYVDSIVAPGSVVIGVGLVDGRVLFNTLHDKIHPIGSFRNDVTYAQLYDYLNCLGISPCFGWMNSNETWRNRTSERAFQLNDAFASVVAKETFKNFKAHYMDPAIDEIFQRWVADGGKASDLIEPVDGFHPSQIAQALNTAVSIEELAKMGVLPPPNPYNDLIAKKFGEQGGY